ncbi:homer protein homolog 3-like [Hemiscyllium ocellatum]|uniref:homer protein homolog 3-like n=1 Tax=Hemiscyllium ocellatum TaxID=170820 RepID=UPI002966E1B3|nr:homer protein homolog 3-like [Hemiscyllium ocellatum]
MQGAGGAAARSPGTGNGQPAAAEGEPGARERERDNPNPGNRRRDSERRDSRKRRERKRLLELNMGEQPIFSARAHVFQIDPATKRNWIPASKHAVTVSFFYDSTRNVYRIISVGGTKAIINSTITPNMSFTKTSQKFGQWADSRANTVYGLGFNSEQQLSQFAERFQEVKEAARLTREKSQDKTELTNPALDIAAPQELSGDLHSPPLQPGSANGSSGPKLYHSESCDGEVMLDSARLKTLFAQGSIGESQWELELFALQESNAKLVQALHESNVTVEQWKKQLSAYKEETEKLRDRVIELESQGEAVVTVATRNTDLSQSVEELETLLKEKEEEIQMLRSQKSDVTDLESDREEALLRLQEVESRNADLEQQLQDVEQTLVDCVNDRERIQCDARKLLDILDVKLYELNDLRHGLAKIAEKEEKS